MPTRSAERNSIIVLFFAVCVAAAAIVFAADVAADGKAALGAATRAARARSLAAVDLDRDGAQDVITGYAADGYGIISVRRGNTDAFAPTDDAVFERIYNGFDPDALVADAHVYRVPVRVDSLHTGDFDRDNRPDLLIGELNGDLYLLSGDGRGGFAAPVAIDLGGKVLSVTAGEFRLPDGWTDAAVAVDAASGVELLIFDGALGMGAPAMRMPVAGRVGAMEFADLDASPFRALAMSVGGRIGIIHGWGRGHRLEPASRVEFIDVGAEVRSLAVGHFLWNRDGFRQIAALGDDGIVRFIERAGTDSRPFTESERTERARRRMFQSRVQIDPESLVGWDAATPDDWSIVREVSAVSRFAAGETSTALLRRADISFTGTDDLLVIGGGDGDIRRIRQHNAGDKPAAEMTLAGDLAITSFDTATRAVATITLPQKVNGRRSLIYVTESDAEPVVIAIAPTGTVTVDRTDDPSGAALPGASVCGAGANDCSLRGAVQFANANPGTVISLGTATYLLNINGSNGCVNEPLATGNTIGDLEVNRTTTFMGSGQANTIIRQAAATNDRVLCMDTDLSPGHTFSFSGLTITGGRDVNSNVGGGGFIGGARNTTLNLTNVTFANNQTTGPNISGGGGVAVTGGDMTVTGCTFGAANPPGASRNDLTLANASNSNSGGGLSYSPGDPLGVGGATGTLTVSGSTFMRNTSSSGSAGGGGLDVFNFNTSTGTANISTSSFSNNQATGTASGGGINNESLTNVNISSTTFTSNSAGNRGGGIYVGGGSLLLNGTDPSIVFTGNTATTAGGSISTASNLSVSGTNTTIGGDIEVTTNGTWTNNAGSILAPTNVLIVGGTFNMNNSTMNVGGNFTLQSGVVVGGAFNGNTGTVNVAGNFSYITGPATPTFSAGTGTFNFDGSGAQSISNNAGITFFNLTDSNTTQPLVFNNSFAVNGTLNVNGAGATIAPVAATVISGTGTLTGTGTARVTRTAATADFLSQYTIANKTLTNLTVEYAGGAAQVGNSLTYGGLRINNAAGVSFPAGATVNGTLTLSAGALALGPSTLNINNGSSVTGGSLTSVVNGTVNYGQTSGGQSVIAANYGNLTFSNFQKVLAGSGSIGIADTFTPGSATGHTITGSTITFNGGGAQTIPAFTYNNLMSSNTGPRTLASTGTIGIAGTFTPGTNVYTITGSTIDFNGAGPQTIPDFNYNNLTSSSTGTRTVANTGTIGIAALFTPGTNSYTVTGSTIAYNGTLAQVMPSGFTTYNNLTLNNPAGVTGFAGLTVNGLLRVQAGTFTSSSTYNNVQIDAGATLAGVNATTINVTGSWVNNGTFTANGNLVNFNGSSAQSIGGSSTTTFNNLTINNTNGVSLQASTPVAGTLTLTNGILNVLGNTLTLNGPVNFTSGSIGSSVTGTVLYDQGSDGQNVAPGNYGNLTFGNFNKVLPSGQIVGIANVFTLGAATGHTVTGNTINFNGTGAQSVPLFNYHNLTVSGARTTNNVTLPSGSIGVAGAFSPTATFTTGTYIKTNNTIDYNGATAQTISAFNYHNLNISAARTTNNVTLAPAGTIGIAGAFSPTATFTTGSYVVSGSTVAYNGTSAQSAPSGFATYNNLTINNAAGVNLAGNTTVNGVLNLMSGNVTTGANLLTVAAGGTSTRTSGHVIGTLQKNVVGGAIAARTADSPVSPQAVFLFPVGTASGYSPLSANFTAGSTGSLTVSAFDGTAPSTPPLADATTLDRYWQLAETGDLTADLTFTYLQGDVDGNENNYVVIRSAAASTPVRLPNGCPASPCVDAVANTITVSGVQSFENFWTAGEPLAPTSANSEVSGRVFADGRALPRATVTLTDESGNVLQAMTNAFGYYRFAEVPTGRSYVISLAAKQYRFAPRVVTVSGSITNLDLVAEPE